MRIALYGIAGLYNYGCEAIVRGTEIFLHTIWPEADIVYYSKQYESDKRVISDINVSVIRQNRDYTLVERCINKGFRIAEIPYSIGDSSQKQVVNESFDIVVSIGGDIYTIPKYLLNRKKYPYYNKLVKLGDTVLKTKTKLLIFGASIGPFGNYQKAINYYARHLRNVDLIIAREKKTVEYLQGLEVKRNVKLLPDPAFLVTLEEEYNVNPEYIGINFSPLSFREIYGNVSDEYIESLVAYIIKLHTSLNRKLMLIPHVISPTSENDNDLLFMEKIVQKIPDTYNSQIIITNPRSFLEAKRELRKCKVVIAARMHCAINALSEGVPTLLLSYSEKSKGMTEFVYGDDKWVVPLDKTMSGVTRKLLELLENEDSLRNYLKKRIKDIRKMYFNNSIYSEMQEVFDNDR